MKRSVFGCVVAVTIAVGACGDSSGGAGVPGDAACAPTPDGGAVDAAGSETGDDGATACGWQPYSDGLTGGYVAYVAYDPRTVGVAWAVSADHLYKSTDHGATWALVSVAPVTLNQLAFPSDSPSHILATANGGLLASTDGGVTWTQTLNGLNVEALLVHPANPLRVFVGTDGGGLLRSDDGGSTFWPTDNGFPYGNVTWLDGDPANVDGVLAAVSDIDAAGNGTNDGSILRSTDGGGTWSAVTSAFAIPWRLSRCASTPSTIYAATGAGLVLSTDDGSTWAPVATAFHDNDADVALAPSDCNTIYETVFGGGMFRSTDGAATLAGPLTHGIPFANAFPRMVSVDPSDATRILGTTPGGLLLSTNAGDDWSLVGGMMGLDVSSIATSPTDPGRLWMSTWGAQAFVRDGAAPWTRVPLAVDYQFVVAPDPAVPNRTFFGTWSVVVSTTDGATFTPGSITTNPMAFAFDPSNAQTIYAATEIGGVFKSTDGGGTWAPASSDILPWDDGNGTNVDVRAIAVDEVNPQRVLLGAYENGLWVSEDGAGTWVQNATLSGSSWGGFAELTGGGEGAALFAVVAGHGVQRSEDGGVTWAEASVGLPTQDVRALVADDAGGGLYASTEFGVFRSRDRGATWEGVETGCSPENGFGDEAIVTTTAGVQLAAVAAGGFGVFVHSL